MRLVSFAASDGEPAGFGRVGGRPGAEVVVPMGPDLVAWLAGAPAVDGEPRPLAGLELRAPVPRPGFVLCVGLNYRDHAAETGQPVPEEPVLFAKHPGAVTGPGAPVRVPAAAGRIDHEAELAVVIGRRAHRCSVAEARAAVGGYTCANDVSARSLQFRSSQWLAGKAVDTFLPLGPWLVTADELGDAGDLAIRCLVNGELRQDSRTSQMIFGVAELIARVSATLTLEPGDVVLTGTPPGVGMAADPPRWVEPGDVMDVVVEGIGVLRNPVEAEATPDGPQG